MKVLALKQELRELMKFKELMGRKVCLIDEEPKVYSNADELVNDLAQKFPESIVNTLTDRPEESKKPREMLCDNRIKCDCCGYKMHHQLDDFDD